MTVEDRPSVSDVSHRAAHAAAVRGAAEVLGKVATLAWTVVAARMLSQDDFGAVNYAMTLMLVLGAVASWGFDAGITRRGAAEPERLPQIYVASQVWRTGLAGLAFLVGGLVVAGSPSVGSWPILVGMLLAGFPELWSLSARSAAAARQAPTAVSTALVLQRLVTAAAVIGALFAGLGAVGVTGAFLLGTLVGWVAHQRALRRIDVAFPVRRLTRDDLAVAVRGTFLIGLSGLVLMLLFRLDIVLLGHFRGPGEVAVYSVAYRILETVVFVTYAINQTIMPVMSATSSTARRRQGWEKAFAVGGFVYLPFMVVCLVENGAVIELLFGDQYADAAAPVLAWLAAAPIFLAAAFFGQAVLVALQRGRSILLAAVAALAVNIVLNLVLIPSDGPLGGAVGAAFATTVGYAVQAAVTLVAMVVAHHRPRVLVPLLGSGGAAVVLALQLALLPLPLVVELVLGAVVYLAVWAVLARWLAPEQYQVVGGLLRRARGGRSDGAEQPSDPADEAADAGADAGVDEGVDERR